MQNTIHNYEQDTIIMTVLVFVADKNLVYNYVIGFGTTCIVDFAHLKIQKNHREWYTDLKLPEMIKEWWFYKSWKFPICLLFQIDFMSHQRWKIGYVNYAHFPKSCHISSIASMLVFDSSCIGIDNKFMASLKSGNTSCLYSIICWKI